MISNDKSNKSSIRITKEKEESKITMPIRKMNSNPLVVNT
jgi:hypothetical protein